MKENFTGNWILLPEQSKYEQGAPPKKATYSFQEGEGGTLNTTTEWTDKEDKESKIRYSKIPYGKKEKYEKPSK